MEEHVTTVGRADALHRIGLALSQPPATVLILGEAGIGKTHLLRDATAAAREAGYRVLPGRARDFGGGLAYASLAEAIG
ncbi:MAG TPA: ATP-binding protein, partial [Thermopolyspora sp.]